MANFYEKIEDMKNYSQDVESDAITDIIMGFMREFLPTFINVSLDDHFDTFSIDSKHWSPYDVKDKAIIDEKIKIQPYHGPGLFISGENTFYIQENYFDIAFDILIYILRDHLKVSCGSKDENSRIYEVTINTTLKKVLDLYYMFDYRRCGYGDQSDTDFEKTLQHIDQIYSDKLYGDFYYDQFIKSFIPTIIEDNISKIDPGNYDEDLLLNEHINIILHSKIKGFFEKSEGSTPFRTIFVDDQLYSDACSLISRFLVDFTHISITRLPGGQTYHITPTLKDLVDAYYMELQRLEYYRGMEDDKEKVKTK